MIELRNNQKSLRIDPKSIEDLCRFILKNISLPDCDLSISLVDDPEMITLNQQYFRKNTTTDVISFPMEKTISNGTLLGDIVICTTQAKRASVEFHSTTEREISLYIIHGILHLIGETDEDPNARRKMENRQNELLNNAQKANCLIRLLN